MRKVGWLGLGALLAAGCGGGSGGAAAPSEITGELGNFTFRAASTNPPITTASGDITATGLKGAITALRLRDRVSSLDETRIYFAANIHGDSTLDIYSVQANGQNLMRLTNHSAFDEAPRVSPKGDKVAFHSTRDGNYEIYTMNVDGSSVTRITNNAAQDVTPGWTPDGSKLVFVTSRYGDSHIARVDIATKAVTQLTSGSDAGDRHPSVTPDGAKVLFSSSRGQGGIYQVPIGGGPATVFVDSSTSFYNAPRISADGTQLLCQRIDPGLKIVRRSMAPGGAFSEISSVTAEDISDFSPDASQVVLTSFVESREEYRMFRYTRDGTAIGAVLPSGVGKNLYHPSWGPMTTERNLVASSGSVFGPKIAGFIFTQSGHTTKSVLAFDCTTASTAVMTEQTGLGNDTSNLVFSIDADSVTMLSYASGVDWKTQKVIGSGTAVATASGALVSFSAADGQVAAVLPFTGSRSGGKPTVKIENGEQVFRGEFLAVTDKTGKNVAPSGAKEVRLNPETGAITVK